jgi:flagellar motor switch protein FliG
MFRKRKEIQTWPIVAEICAKMDKAEQMFMDAIRSRDEEIARLKHQLSTRD